MAFVRVATASNLSPDSVIEVNVGDELYALCNVRGSITALGGVCLHNGGPIGQGQVHGTHVFCPWHMWGYDCRTGANDFDPTRKLAVYPVKVEGDDILIDIS